MSYQFQKHYDLEEARALLPTVRKWIEQIWMLQKTLRRLERQLSGLPEKGVDRGGTLVNDKIRVLADLKSVIQNFENRSIRIKDAERGLIDFPSLRGGREIFLCWEMGEEDIEHWHDLETGFSGREKI